MHERMDYLIFSSPVRIYSMSLLVYDFSGTSSIQWPTIFLDMLIYTGFLCRGDELNTTIMSTMQGGQGLKHSRRMRCPFCVCFGWQLNDTTGRLARHERKGIIR